MDKIFSSNIKNGFKKIIKPGDNILIHSNTLPLIKSYRKKEKIERIEIERFSNIFIDLFIEMVTDEGTVFFPTFNWDFCKGKVFDYINTLSRTGSLTSIAMKRKDFKRTLHPIYSFTVKGKYQQYLCSLNNKNAFEKNSPLGFLYKVNGKILLINLDFQSSFTYAHYIEEQLNVDYRYHKDFTADYIGPDGKKTKKTYNMFVRDLDKGVNTYLNPVGEILEKEGIAKTYEIEGNTFTVMNASEVYERIKLELEKSPYIMVRFDKTEGKRE